MTKADWFSEGAAGSATVKAVWADAAVESNSATVVLAQIPSRSGLPLTNAGMWLEMPSYPMLPETSFKVYLYAHTGGKALGAWIAAIYIDAAPDVTFVEIDGDEFYDITVNDFLDDKDGVQKVALVANRKADFAPDGSKPGAIVSDKLLLAKVTFKVRSGTKPGVIATALTLRVNGMEAGPVTLVSHVDGWMYSAAAEWTPTRYWAPSPVRSTSPSASRGSADTTAE